MTTNIMPVEDPELHLKVHVTSLTLTVGAGYQV